jgi:hypothetical protein
MLLNKFLLDLSESNDCPMNFAVAREPIQLGLELGLELNVCARKPPRTSHSKRRIRGYPNASERCNEEP